MFSASFYFVLSRPTCYGVACHNKEICTNKRELNVRNSDKAVGNNNKRKQKKREREKAREIFFYDTIFKFLYYFYSKINFLSSRRFIQDLSKTKWQKKCDSIVFSVFSQRRATKSRRSLDCKERSKSKERD